MDYSKIITVEPGKRGGQPCIRGLRMTVSDVLEYLATGMSQEEILAEFPELTQEDFRACFAFAADCVKTRGELPQSEISVDEHRDLILNSFGSSRELYASFGGGEAALRWMRDEAGSAPV